MRGPIDFPVSCREARRPRGLAFALLAFSASAAAAQTAVPAVPPVLPAPSPLASIPGVTLQYYDVSGITIEALRASIDAQRPKDPMTGQAVPASVRWSIQTRLKKETLGTQCKITGATAVFAGEAVMPRLVNEAAVPAPVLAQWRSFAASLEQEQAARLRVPYARVAEVEKAVMASTCENAKAAADKAIAEIQTAPPPIAPAPPTQ